MELGQLIEYNMRNIFLEKSYTKCCKETIPRPFSKKSKLGISFIHFVFTVCQIEGYQNILKITCRTLAITSEKAFLTSKIRSGTSIPASFSS